jgi:hypothetical protein
MVKLTGGGYGSAKHVDKKAGMKVEPKARAMSPEAAGQQGAALAFARKPLEQGPGYTPGKQGDTGIANARKGPAGAGPGGMGRTIYASGSQSATPPARPLPAGRDTLLEFGPDVPGRRR